ncbi:MAG TPA: fluoride efflux transporter CrcB [Anaerolineae bacterium]|nr:fluoride efflux transporter CrcB [Anaerolineae bacterium]
MIGVGGFFGAISRFVIGYGVQKITPWAEMPMGTLAVNLLGCFLIGLLSQFSVAMVTIETRSLIFVGFLGSLTTFSTFSNETLLLSQKGLTGLSVLNLILQVSLGLFAVWGGQVVGQVVQS